MSATHTILELAFWREQLGNIIGDCVACADRCERILKDDPPTKYFMQAGIGGEIGSMTLFVWTTQLAKVFCNGDGHKLSFQKYFATLCHPTNRPMMESLLKENQKDTKFLPPEWSSYDDLLQYVRNCKTELRTHRATIQFVEMGRNKVYAHTEPRGATPIVSPYNLNEAVQRLSELTTIGTKFFNGYVHGMGSPRTLADYDKTNLDETIASFWRARLTTTSIRG